MKDDHEYEPFFYYSNARIPQKFTELLKEAKAEGKGFLYSILVLKDNAGNQYEVVLRREKETARKRFFSKNPFWDSYVDFLIRGFK
jgi:hypothetical protein